MSNYADKLKFDFYIGNNEDATRVGGDVADSSEALCFQVGSEWFTLTDDLVRKLQGLCDRHLEAREVVEAKKTGRFEPLCARCGCCRLSHFKTTIGELCPGSDDEYYTVKP